MAGAEELAERIQGLHDIPATVRETCERLLVDVAGLCILARRGDYGKAALAGFGEAGPATAIGHPRRASAACAAFVNGPAAHGEDYDDRVEAGPVHAGAVVVPAVLAAAELEGANGSWVLRGVAVGVEILCRLSLVVPKALHASGFHPTAVFGAPAAAAAVASTLRLEMNELVDALGISGSMAGGIIEYLAEGTWTKRLHAGWAAQSGLRAALLGRAGFAGPRTVLEGVHGLFQGFAHSREGDYAALTETFGERWVLETLGFKPYPCGTMAHPYIDCARRPGGGGAPAASARRRPRAAQPRRARGEILGERAPRRLARRKNRRRAGAGPHPLRRAGRAFAIARLTAGTAMSQRENELADR